MTLQCPKCMRVYDDETCWTLCPHNPLSRAHDAPYCREHDLFHCPICTDKEKP
jgi:hypothetical protein